MTAGADESVTVPLDIDTTPLDTDMIPLDTDTVSTEDGEIVAKLDRETVILACLQDRHLYGAD